MTRTEVLSPPTNRHRCVFPPDGTMARPGILPSREFTEFEESSEPSTLSDEALLGRYRDDRRPEDFHELVGRYSGPLGRYLTRYLADPVMAEDVLQDTFLHVHSKCGQYGDGWRVRPWLYAIANHRAIDALRRSSRHARIQLESQAGEDAESLLDRLASDDPGPLETLEARERQRWVRDSIASLPKPMRQVMALVYDRDLSYGEIAELTGVPVGTVRSRLHTAIGRLRHKAERYERAGRR